MADRLNIRKNVRSTVLAFTLNIGLTFISYRLVVQQGGLSTLGLWSALTAAIYIIRLGDVGMGSATERFVARINAETDAPDARAYIDSALILNLVLFLTLAIAGWLLLSKAMWLIVPDREHRQLAHSILPLMLAGFILSNLANVVLSGLRGVHLGFLAARITVIGTFLQLCCVLFLVPDYGIEGLAWAQVIQHVAVGSLSWILLNKKLSVYHERLSWMPKTGSYSRLRNLIGISLKMQAVNLLNGLFEPCSKFIVGHSGGLSTLGLFEVAYKIVSLPRNAIISGVLSVTPAMTNLIREDLSEARRIYRRAKWLVAVAAGIAAIGSAAASPIVSSLLLGSVSSLLFLFTCALGIGFWVNAVGAPAYSIGFASGILRGNIISAAATLVVLLLGGVTMAPWWPNVGPAAASAAALAVGGGAIIWFNQRTIGL